MGQHGIRGSRTYLDVLNEKELETIFKWRNDLGLLKSIKVHPLPVAMYEMEEWFKRNQSDKNQIVWGIHDVRSGDLIGIVRLMFIDWISSSTEFGIYVGEETYRNKGLGEEAVKLALNFAFNEINLHRVYLKVTESNKRAVKLYESCGFVKEGILREHFWSEGKYNNVLIMGLLKNEYLE